MSFPGFSATVPDLVPTCTVTVGVSPELPEPEEVEPEVAEPEEAEAGSSHHYCKR